MSLIEFYSFIKKELPKTLINAKRQQDPMKINSMAFGKRSAGTIAIKTTL